MALKFLDPPSESIRAFESVFIPRKGKIGGVGVDAHRTKRMLQARPALPIYTLGLDSFTRGSLQDATLVGWHYLVADDMGKAGADVYCDAEQKRHSFGALNQGIIVDHTASELGRIKQDARYDERDYEMRLLRVPALYVVALWLKAEDTTNDRFVSVGPAVSRLPLGGTYSWTELYQHLHNDAETRILHDMPIKGQPGRRR